MTTLNSRFIDFLKGLPNTESLDETRAPADQGEYADFLIGASVIVEVKSLETDPTHKVDAALAELSKRPDFPRFFGQVEVRDLVRQLPDGERILEGLVERLTRSLDTNIRKANRQMRSTAQARSISPHTGLLVLLNEEISILNPKLVAKRASQILAARDQSQSLRYPAVTHIWLISETHVFRTQDGGTGFPSIIIEGFMGPATDEAEHAFTRLEQCWANYIGRPLKQHAPVVDIAEAHMADRPTK